MWLILHCIVFFTTATPGIKPEYALLEKEAVFQAKTFQAVKAITILFYFFV
jgi:hypothetical protein